MERHGGDTGAREVGEPDQERGDDTVDPRLGDEDPARPQAGGGGFGEGYDREPDTAQENQEPNFARGISREPEPGTEHHGRFSEGQEQRPETTEKDREGRFGG